MPRVMTALRTFEGIEGKIRAGQRFEVDSDLRVQQLIKLGLAQEGTAGNNPAIIPKSTPASGDPKLRRVTLISGQENEAPILTGGTLTADTSNYRIGTQGHRLATTAAATSTARYGYAPLLEFPPASTVCAWIYIEDKTAITQINLELHWPTGATWRRTATNANLKNGWNLLRFPAHAGLAFADLERNWTKGMDWARVVMVTTGAAAITIGHVFLECPEKAMILFIEDGGYTTFLNSAYPDLVRRNIPVTWSIDPLKLGTGTDGSPAQRITEADVRRVSTENGNTINFHGYDGEPTANMTPAQIKADNLNSLKWLKARGYFEDTFWRSAWVQNSAANAAAARNLLIAYATPTSSASLDSFPFIDQWNIPRVSVHGATEVFLDQTFRIMKLTRQIFVCYTHGLTEGVSTDVNPTQWANFLRLVDTALNEKWLEGVTFDQLLKRYNIKPTQNWIEEYYSNPIV